MGKDEVGDKDKWKEGKTTVRKSTIEKDEEDQKGSVATSKDPGKNSKISKSEHQFAHRIGGPPLKPRRFGLAFGNQEFDHGRNLSFCRADAVAFREFLSKNGFSIGAAVLDAKKAEGKRAAFGLAQELDDQSEVVFTVSSHGCMEGGEKCVEFRNGVVKIRELQGYFLAEMPKAAIFVHDHCLSQNHPGEVTTPTVQREFRSHNFAIIFACPEYGVAKEKSDIRQGCLSWAMLEALKLVPSANINTLVIAADDLLRERYPSEEFNLMVMGKPRVLEEFRFTDPEFVV